MLHITNGDCTSDMLRKAGIAGEIVTWADPLHDGPVPRAGVVGDDTFRQTRAKFLADTGAGEVESIHQHLQAWEAGLSRWREHEQVILWLEHDLFDQLLLLRHLDWFTRQGIGPGQLHLVCIGGYPGIERFVGLGQLTPEQLAPLISRRQAVTAEQFELASQAWQAFTAADPAALVALLKDDLSALPFLADALRRHLQQYPALGTGLSRTERQGLEAIAAGRGTLGAAFVAQQTREASPFLGDTMFYWHMARLATQPGALLRIEQGGASDRTSDAAASLTEAGRQVLAGEADYVQLGGLDRWLGGVHLHGRDVRWRWDERGGCLMSDV